MTAPGAQPELQAGKGTWLLIDHKLFNIFCGRSCCEVPDSFSTDSEGRELQSHFLWASHLAWKRPSKAVLVHEGCWADGWWCRGAASTMSDTDLHTPLLPTRFFPGFPTCALERLHLQFLSWCTGPQAQSWE